MPQSAKDVFDDCFALRDFLRVRRRPPGRPLHHGFVRPPRDHPIRPARAWWFERAGGARGPVIINDPGLAAALTCAPAFQAVPAGTLTGVAAAS